MIRRLFFASAATLILSVPAIAQQTKILSAEKHNEYGLVYNLPITELKIEVTASRTVRKAGPYFQYAKKYIGTDNVIKEDSETWIITDIKVSPYGVPDTDKQYLMQLKAGALTYIGVSDNGMLLSINQRPESKLSTRAETPVAESIKAFSGKEYLQFVNGDFLASQSSAKQAQILSEILMEVRDAKTSLSRGTAETMPTDGRQLELMLNSLAEQEKALTQAFTGSETVSTYNSFYTFQPEKEGETILFRLSDFSGFKNADDYSGDPVYISVSDIVEAKLPTDANGEEKKLPKDAVIYAIPGSAKISVKASGHEYFSKVMDFAQFGTTFGFNPTLFTSKKDPSSATFNPATGAPIEIKEMNTDIKVIQ